MHDAVTGANKTDYHLTGVNIGRDFEVKEVADIRTAVEGDRAPNGSPLVSVRVKGGTGMGFTSSRPR